MCFVPLRFRSISIGMYEQSLGAVILPQARSPAFTAFTGIQAKGERDTAYIRVDPRHDGATKQQTTAYSSRREEYNYVLFNKG